MLRRLTWILLGFFAASLAAGATQVAFAMAPTGVGAFTGEDWSARAGAILLLVLNGATLSAVFAAPFALVAISLAYYQDLRGWPYFVLVGLAIGAGGFLVLSGADLPGRSTMLNPYALKAYLASGFIGGLVYWFIAGRRTDSLPSAAPAKEKTAVRA